MKPSLVAILTNPLSSMIKEIASKKEADRRGPERTKSVTIRIRTTSNGSEAMLATKPLVAMPMTSCNTRLPRCLSSRERSDFATLRVLLDYSEANAYEMSDYNAGERGGWRYARRTRYIAASRRRRLPMMPQRRQTTPGNLAKSRRTNQPGQISPR